MTRSIAILAFIFFVIGAATLTSTANAKPIDLKALLPKGAEGWTPKQPDGEYTYDNLFDLIDGGAEMYRSLNVKRVLSRTYSKEDGADIIVDLFDMGSPSDAFGAFHCDIREEADAGVGRESEFQGGSLFFWKDRYFVSVVALEETEATKKAVFALGKLIAKSIRSNGAGPAIAALLPKEHLQKKELFYFHDLAALQRRVAISGENPLNLSAKTEGLLARYRGMFGQGASNEEALALFLVVGYPTEKEASIAAGEMKWASLDKAKPGEVVKIGEKKLAGYFQKGARLFVVLDASSEEIARYLLESAKSGK